VGWPADPPQLGSRRRRGGRSLVGAAVGPRSRRVGLESRPALRGPGARTSTLSYSLSCRVPLGDRWRWCSTLKIKSVTRTRFLVSKAGRVTGVPGCSCGASSLVWFRSFVAVSAEPDRFAIARRSLESNAAAPRRVRIPRVISISSLFFRRPRVAMAGAATTWACRTRLRALAQWVKPVVDLSFSSKGRASSIEVQSGGVGPFLFRTGHPGGRRS